MYEDVRESHALEVLDHFLRTEIEIPVLQLAQKTDDIDDLLKQRDIKVLDYQHHMRKLEAQQEKLPTVTKKEPVEEEIKSRQVSHTCTCD
jgi:hypothetical protein